MKKNEVISLIKRIEREYDSYNDGGVSFVKHLANEVLNIKGHDRADVVNLLLDEIKYDENELCSIALQTIVEMKEIQLAPSLEKIYLERRHFNDENWSHSIIVALMKLRYKSTKSLYYDYVKAFMAGDPGKSFFLLVQYCNVDAESALPLLSDFYVENFNALRDFLESRIGFLVKYFSHNEANYLPVLVEQILSKDKMIGLQLKSLIIDYFNSNMKNLYKKVFIEETLKKLAEIKV